MSNNEIWLVGEVVNRLPVRIKSTPEAMIKLELAWSDGMIGVCPAFGSREQAMRYAKEQEEKFGTLRDVWAVDRAS